MATYSSSYEAFEPPVQAPGHGSPASTTSARRKNDLCVCISTTKEGDKAGLEISSNQWMSEDDEGG